MKQLQSPWRGFPRSLSSLLLAAFLIITGFFLVTEHTAHPSTVLPFLLIVACLLMHGFMHGGHGAYAVQMHNHKGGPQ